MGEDDLRTQRDLPRATEPGSAQFLWQVTNRPAARTWTRREGILHAYERGEPRAAVGQIESARRGQQTHELDAYSTMSLGRIGWSIGHERAAACSAVKATRFAGDPNKFGSALTERVRSSTNVDNKLLISHT